MALRDQLLDRDISPDKSNKILLASRLDQSLQVVKLIPQKTINLNDIGDRR